MTWAVNNRIHRRDSVYKNGGHHLIGEGCQFLGGIPTMHGRVRFDAGVISTCRIVAYDAVHVSSLVFFNGCSDQTVTLGEWSFVGSGSRLITASDDFSGASGPVGPWGRNEMQRGDIVFGPFSGVAVGCTVLPGVAGADLQRVVACEHH